MENNLVSIIIPIYKVEAYLQDCINLVVNQTYNNIEIILIDDGSPDNCPKICDDYASKYDRIKVIHQKNGGLSNARNSGLDVATGDYIFFLDSDDFISNDCIEVLLKLSLKTDANIVVGNNMNFSDESEIHEDDSESSFSIYSGYDCCKKMVVGKEPIPVVSWNKLFKASMFGNLRFPDGKIYEDAYTTWKLFFQSDKVCFTTKTTYYYRLRSGSIMSAPFSSKTFDRLGADEDRIEFFKDKDKVLYSWSVRNYLFRLMEYYFNVKSYINNCDFKYSPRDLHEMYKNAFLYKEIKSICSIGEKIKLILFFILPNLYYNLKMIKER